MNIYKRYENELLESVIPFWMTNCVDYDFGGYFTSLDRDGSVYDTEKYMWMQWRIVYMFSELYKSKYSRSEYLDIALNGYDFLSKNGKDENGYYYFALNRRGVPSIAPYSIYSNCFAAMGAASLYKATNEEKYRNEAIADVEKYIERIKNPKGKWSKSLSGKEEYLEFGHYMMFINLGILMKDTLGIERFDKRVDEYIDLILEKFWSEKYGVIFENIKGTGETDLSSCAGRHINPGHGLEAMWFILSYAEKTNNKVLINKVSNIIIQILEFGWDKEYGGLFYFMDVLGKPKIELEWDMKLWWVHNEAGIASLYGYYLTGEKRFWDWFIKIDKWSWEHFPDREYGEWFGYLNRYGKPTHLLKGSKWKTFFHLPRYLLVVMELLEKIDDKGQR